MCFRKVLMKRISFRKNNDLGLNRVLGATAVVKEDVSDKGGIVHVDGKDWSARSVEPIQEGSNCVIEKIDGTILRIRKE
jgi:membrane protein implicated in regulation of membrane protease activity